MSIRGSCLCGGVGYVIAGRPLLLENCHCSMCRKAHGSAYTTFAKIRREDFSIIRGAELIARYASSARVQRSFCQRCGAKFTFDWADAPAFLWIAAGTFDDDPEMLPAFHIFVGSKAPWFEIEDDLPQYEAYPPADSG